MPDVTVFFRDVSKWKSPDNKYKEPELAEIISNRDVNNLYYLSMCILNIRKKAKEEKRPTVYDNSALEEFMDAFALMMDEISRKKHIRDFIAYRPGPTLEISAPVKYD